MSELIHLEPEALYVRRGGKIIVDQGGEITRQGAPAPAVAPLHDNSGGAAGNALAAISAGPSYSQADAVAMRNALASLTAKYNELLAVVRGLGMVGPEGTAGMAPPVGG